jgi:hypothetical protein
MVPGGAIGEAVDRQLRVLARTSLDRYSIDELESRFPTMELLMDTARERHSTELGARLAAAHAIALLGQRAGDRFGGRHQRAGGRQGDDGIDFR